MENIFLLVCVCVHMCARATERLEGKARARRASCWLLECDMQRSLARCIILYLKTLPLRRSSGWKMRRLEKLGGFKRESGQILISKLIMWRYTVGWFSGAPRAWNNWPEYASRCPHSGGEAVENKLHPPAVIASLQILFLSGLNTLERAAGKLAKVLGKKCARW